MAISLRSARSLVVGDVSLEGDVIVFQGSTNTYTITDFNSFSEYSVSSDYGTASVAGDVITLVVPSPATQNQIKLTVLKDSKSSVFTVAIGAAVVNTPSITSPVNGVTGVALQPTIEASAFSNTPPAQGVHQSSQWQVATSADFLNIAYDSGVDIVNKTSITIPSPLSLNTQHWVRVRYTSSTIGTSDWSGVVSFTTTNQYVVEPTVSVTDGPNNVGETPTITTSAFSVFGGSDTHALTDWQIVKVSDSSVVWQSLGNTSNKTSVVVPAGVLLESQQYIARARHNGTTVGSSAWGEYSFTTKAEFFTFDPSSVGLPYGGGYYAGKIVTGGVTYALVVAPKAQGGEVGTALPWKTSQSTTTGTTSINDGLANTNAMIAAGASAHPAANFCNNLSINGYNDWYLPAKDELEILYRYLKPTTDANSTSSGANTSSVPTTGNYTHGSPAQTSVTIFRTGNNEAFVSGYYWASTEYSSTYGWLQSFYDGVQDGILNKSNALYVRGVRRIAI